MNVYLVRNFFSFMLIYRFFSTDRMSKYLNDAEIQAELFVPSDSEGEAETEADLEQ